MGATRRSLQVVVAVAATAIIAAVLVRANPSTAGARGPVGAQDTGAALRAPSLPGPAAPAPRTSFASLGVGACGASSSGRSGTEPQHVASPAVLEDGARASACRATSTPAHDPAFDR